jgi:hypothetical protein
MYVEYPLPHTPLDPKSSYKIIDLLDHAGSCFLWNIWKYLSPFTFGALFMSIAIIYLCLYSYIHYKMIYTVFFQNKDKSDKTAKLQRMLYLAILSQAICFIILFVIPLLTTVIFVLTNSDLSSIVIMFLFICLDFYEIITYIILLYFIKCFRDSLKGLLVKIKKLLCFKNVVSDDGKLFHLSGNHNNAKTTILRK